MHISDLFNDFYGEVKVKYIPEINQDMFLTFKRQASIEQKALFQGPIVDLYNTRDDQQSYSYFREMTVAEHLAHTIAERHTSKTDLLGEERELFYNNILAELLESMDEPQGQTVLSEKQKPTASEQKTAQQPLHSTHSTTRSVQP